MTSVPSMATYINQAGKLRVKHYSDTSATLTAAPFGGAVNLTLINLTAEQVSGLVTLFGQWAQVGALASEKEVL